MGFQDYISEAEAAVFSGVSISTLNRFAEAGYLKIESDLDGLRLFSKSELSNVFGLENFHRFEGRKSPGNRNAAIAEKPEILRRTLEVQANNEARSSLADQIEIIRLSPPSVELEMPGAGVGDRPQTQTLKSVETTCDSQVAQNQAAEARIKQLEYELQLTKVDLLAREKALEEREQRLKDLEEQRSWLRTRLERFEEKSERDQLLLLAETQTIKRLIHVQEQRRSPLRSALEWIGFLLPEPQQSSTIEIKKEPAPQVRMKTTPDQK